MSVFKTTDYCAKCGESPDSSTHVLPSGHDYRPPERRRGLICETCQERPANIHYTNCDLDPRLTRHWCEDCAIGEGIISSSSAPSKRALPNGPDVAAALRKRLKQHGRDDTFVRTRITWRELRALLDDYDHLRETREGNE